MSAEINSKQHESDSEQHESDSINHQLDNAHPVANLSDNGATVPKLEFAEEDIRPVIEAIAATGAFWMEWDELKNLLSFKQKQVLSEYPECKMTVEQQTASLGETYQELVHRLDEALLSFDVGPPFTLQRLCEILLSPQSIYPKLSKLALALEKNLLVSTMLTGSVEPHSQMMEQGGDGPEETVEKPELQSPSEQNGGDVVMSDRDEIMADAEVGIPTEETVEPSEINPAPEVVAPTAETAHSNS